MKSVIGCIVLMLGTASTEIQAADDASFPALTYVGTMGVTYGGDKIYSTSGTNGYSSNLRAGEFLQFGIGALWQPSAAPVALQLTLNWQNDDFRYNYFYSGKVDNGFNRFPIELISYYLPTPDFRVGVGGRFVKSPKAYVDSNNSKEELRFGDTTGTVFEVGYHLGDGGWINLRYVSERYQPDVLVQNGQSVSVAGSPSINGSHIGINLVLNLEPAFRSSSSSSASSNIPEPEQQSTYPAGSMHVTPRHEHHRETVEQEVVLIPGKPDSKTPAKPDDDKAR